jgi:hypothetical protein
LLKDCEKSAVEVSDYQCFTQMTGPRCNKAFFVVIYTLALPYFIIVCTFCIENDAEVLFPAHYTWNVADKGFKMDFTMNKLAMINSREIILEK